MSSFQGVGPSSGVPRGVGGPEEPKAAGPLAGLTAGPTPSLGPAQAAQGGGHIAARGGVSLSQLNGTVGRPLVGQQSSPGVVRVYEDSARGDVNSLFIAARGQGEVSEAAIKCLALMVTAPESYTARPALDALNFLIEGGGPEGQMALSQLAEHFRNRNPEVRSMVESTLGGYISEAVDEILIARGDPDPFAFLVSQKKHIAQAVFGHLISSRAPVPESCKLSIANFMAYLVAGGGGEAGPALDYLDRLADSSAEAAKAVILYAPLMVSAGGPFAVKTMNILERLAQHSDDAVAQKAVETIGEIAAGPRGGPGPVLMTPPKARAKAAAAGAASSPAVGDLPSGKVPPTTVPPGEADTSVGVGG